MAKAEEKRKLKISKKIILNIKNTLVRNSSDRNVAIIQAVGSNKAFNRNPKFLAASVDETGKYVKFEIKLENLLDNHTVFVQGAAVSLRKYVEERIKNHRDNVEKEKKAIKEETNDKKRKKLRLRQFISKEICVFEEEGDPVD